MVRDQNPIFFARKYHSDMKNSERHAGCPALGHLLGRLDSHIFLDPTDNHIMAVREAFESLTKKSVEISVYNPA